MMRDRVVLLLSVLTFLLLHSCNREEEAEHVKLSDKLTSQTARKIREKYNLKLFRSGGGMMYSIFSVSQGVEGILPESLEESRELYFLVAIEYVEKFNSDLEIRPYIIKQPFDFRTLNLTLRNRSRGSYSPTQIERINNGKKEQKISYSIRGEAGDLQTVHVETIEEALAKVSPETRQKYLEAINVDHKKKKYR